MKKILVFLFLMVIFFTAGVAYASCKIEKLGACKADLGNGINKKIQDKMIPNNYDNLTIPNGATNSRTQLGQPMAPQHINQTPAQEESTQPYDANCQFGSCLNTQNQGQRENFK